MTPQQSQVRHFPNFLCTEPKRFTITDRDESEKYSNSMSVSLEVQLFEMELTPRCRAVVLVLFHPRPPSENGNLSGTTHTNTQTWK